MVTLKDVAAACGVSVATVSRALNNLGDINAVTAERIRQQAGSMGYFPNAAAKALKTNHSNNIGILYENQMDHEYFSMIIDTIRHTAEARGYDITFLGRNVGSGHMSYYEHARYRGLDGIIIIQGDFTSDEFMKLAKSEFPCVALDFEYVDCDCIASDNVNGIGELVNAAAKLGHSRIAFIHGEIGDVTVKRIEGFNKAMKENGLEIPERYIVSGNYHNPEKSGEMTEKLMRLPEPPTCILYPDDFSALGGLSQLERMGFSVPQDVSIAGYDGIRLADITRPRLTTWRQDFESIGRMAVSLITDAIENPAVHAADTHFVTGSLYTGRSMAEPRG